ncbi:phosphate regulon sensor histidine kinase PhoR [Paraburkholderia hayleyella]|uniref:phosphate regulon sensor histidine kinase PhoR n=1 Tax=Paraburkholderia hayleyella TaxID=2152889 RepID=UPI0012911E68|nr:phosphate regulon sensor histidine kinase PhoR [Paraburkholderia hayleyella]
MNSIWARFLVFLVLLLVLCAAVAAIAGLQAALLLAVLLLLAHGLVGAFHQQRLWRLLDTPAYGEIPSASGAWGEIYYRLYRLAKRWHGQIRDVEQQHARFIQAIQASPNGVVMLDERDRIEWCNAISQAHFGLDAPRDLHQYMTHLVRQPDFVRYLNAHQYAGALLMPGMGEARHNVLSVQVIPYGERRKLVLSHDITELERTDAMRRDFVANVSHELKTPLTVLTGFLETMRELPLSVAEQQRYLALMAQQAARMQHIVSGLLVLAQLEGDSRLPGEQALEMHAVLRHLREDAENLSGGRHRITFDCDERLSVTGAESEILSALGNLVTNAIRYTPEGGAIDVSWYEVKGCATFAVSDSGLGIPMADMSRLTERFYRVDRSRSRDTGGTGLGLAIVKHVLQRHDARLEIKSEEGRGSTFTVQFPVARTVRCETPAA